MIKLSFEQKKNIGLQYVLDLLSPCSPLGMREIRNLTFCGPGDEDLLEKELKNLERLTNAFDRESPAIENIRNVLGEMKDIEKTLQKGKMYPLGEVELFEVKNLLIQLERLIPAFEELNSRLGLSGISFARCSEALDLLDPEGKRVATFYVSESYSEELLKIRREKRELDGELRRLGRKTPGDAFLTRRADVIAREEREESAVRDRLSAAIRPWLGAMLLNIRQAGQLDLLLEKARLALRFRAVRPEITGGEIVLEEVVNPWIAGLLKNQGKKYVPVTIRLGRGVTVLTGANMGGKTVALKTVVLNVLLAHMGFFVFAEKAEIPLFDSIHLVSENLQSAQRGLSSFGGEIIRLREVLAEERAGFALIVLDEFASGTNPEEAAAILRALTRYLNRRNAVALLTTHFDGIASLANAHYQVTGLKNADPERLRAEAAAAGGGALELISRHMDYRLYKVEEEAACPRDALNICRLLGLDNEILKLLEEEY